MEIASWVRCNLLFISMPFEVQSYVKRVTKLSSKEDYTRPSTFGKFSSIFKFSVRCDHYRTMGYSDGGPYDPIKLQIFLNKNPGFLSILLRKEFYNEITEHVCFKVESEMSSLLVIFKNKDNKFIYQRFWPFCRMFIKFKRVVWLCQRMSPMKQMKTT